MDKHHHSPPQPDRRNFLTKAAAIVIGGIITVIPALSGLFVLFDPLRRGVGVGRAVRVASLNSLPENGEPRKFDVIDTRVDAWNRTPNVPIGSVYLQRIGPNDVRALNTICPHAGCSVGFRSDAGHFHCPCHDSSFAIDGSILNPKSPSPRAMDQLSVQIREGGEIWVKYQNYRKGVHEKKPV